MAVAEKYKVHPIPGKVRRKVIEYVPKQVQTGEVELANGKVEKQFKTVRERVESEVVEDGGFLVVTTRGDAIRVKDRAELARLGFASPAPLVDLESGEEMPRTEIGLLNRGIPLESLVSGYIPSNQAEAK